MDPSNIESNFKSNSDLKANLEPPPSPNLLPLEPSSRTSIPCDGLVNVGTVTHQR
jgi:hypothetical protein